VPETVTDTAHPGLGGIPFVLGGNVFGMTADRDASFAVLDAFYEVGGRSIDTADGYSSWIAGNKGGESEALIGEWMESRKVRPEMKIATKTGQGGIAGLLDPDKVAAAIDDSLERLRTDYVDLYYVHRDQPDMAMEGIVETFHKVHAAGKARELGISNVSHDRLQLALGHAEANGLIPFTVLQPNFRWKRMNLPCRAALRCCPITGSPPVSCQASIAARLILSAASASRTPGCSQKLAGLPCPCWKP